MDQCWQFLILSVDAQTVATASKTVPPDVLQQIANNFVTNLFQPLLLFFFLGFAVPLLKVPLEYPKALYQSITIYLLVAIGWHGGELMAQLSGKQLEFAAGFVVVGFLVNILIGIVATVACRKMTSMRRVDAVTVGAYYGSDSAGTFVTCVGVLSMLNIQHDSYMPVMLAVMEIPGCLVGLFLVARLRSKGMDPLGNMPDEPGYNPNAMPDHSKGWHDADHRQHTEVSKAAKSPDATGAHSGNGFASAINWQILHEVFFNAGLYLLFGGILVGYISGLQGEKAIEEPNHFFLFIFKGVLCLFLLEMGITACSHLRDLKTAGFGFIIFGLLMPNIFAAFGMTVMHAYSWFRGEPFLLGSYALFACLCAAASYIAVPAVQRLAIPEASPTLPLAASLGLTFTYNVTLGIPVYIETARYLIVAFPSG